MTKEKTTSDSEVRAERNNTETTAVIKQAVLVRFGEIALKGLNRGKFEQRLMRNIALKLKAYGSYQVNISQSRIWIEPDIYTRDYDDLTVKKMIKRACKVAASTFGVVSVSPVIMFTGDWQKLQAETLKMAASELAKGKQTFKVNCKRADKDYPLTSMEIMAELGAAVLEAYPELKVDLHAPDFVINVEVRKQFSLYTEIIPGVRGLPAGSSAKGLVLLSGGIDSPVAAYMMASRGMEIEAIYFHTFPYTSDLAKQKVIDLAQIISQYAGKVILHVVDFTDINLELKNNCPPDMITIVMRRMMMRIAEACAHNRACKALITGESLGQVASQTTEAIMATNEVTTLPVFRPLIGLDKDDTIKLARQIGTFEKSIEPYEDCCTIFVSKHPKTRPNAKAVTGSDATLDIERLVAAGINKITSYDIRSEQIKEKAGLCLPVQDLKVEESAHATQD